MPEDRKYVEVDGKKYPLKTETERATSREQNSSKPQPEAKESRQVNLPRPHVPRSGNRTVTLALLVAFGTYALSGKSGVNKLVRLRGVLGQPVPTPSDTNASITMYEPGLGSKVSNFGSVFTPRALFAWMGLFVILQVLADFDATTEIAASLAMLILISTLITLGPDALDNLGTFFSSQGTTNANN